LIAIGDIRQILFDSQTKGGVTPQTARVAQECVSHLAGRIGFANKTSIGAEDFDSVSTRMRSTEIAIEDLTDTMKRIWEGIKKFFAALYNWIKEFLFGKKAQMKDAQEQLAETKKNAEDLKKKGDLPEEAKQRIRIQFYRNKARYLITTNGDLRIEEALEHSATFKQFFMQYADTFRAFAQRQGPILGEFEKQYPSADVIGSFYIDEDFLRKMKLKTAKRTDFVALHPNNTLLSSEVLPGGMQMTFNILKSGQLPGPESIKQNSIKLVSAYSGDTIRGGVEMIVDNNDISTIIKEIEALRKLETKAFELMIDNFKHVEDKYKQLIGTIPSRWGNVDPKLFSLFTNLLTNVQRYTTTMFHKGNQDMLTLFGNHTDALNDYVNACIRACSMAVLAKTNCFRKKGAFLNIFQLRILIMSFANRFGRGLVAAMEEDLPEVPVEEVVAADSAESDLVEAADASAEVDAGVGEIESAQADSDTLADIADTLEASEETGGLDPVAAQVAEVAVESIYARLGVQRSKMPAMEAFGAKETRVRATRIAVEEIRGTLKKIWDAIVAAFGKVMDWIKNFFRAIFDANEKLAQRADALEKRANATKGTAKEETMPAANVAKAQVLAGVAGLAKFVKDNDSKVSGVLPKSIKEIVQSKEKFDAFKSEAVSAPAGYRVGDEGAGEGMQWLVSDPMPGNAVFKLKVPKETTEGEAAFQAIGQMTAALGVDGKADTAKDEKVAVLSTAEVAKIATAARSLTKANLEARKVENGLEQQIKSLQADARSAAALAPKEDESGAAARSRMVGKAISAGINYQIKEVSVKVSYATNVAKAALDYAERSLAQYKEEKKTEEKK